MGSIIKDRFADSIGFGNSFPKSREKTWENHEQRNPMNMTFAHWHMVSVSKGPKPKTWGSTSFPSSRILFDDDVLVVREYWDNESPDKTTTHFAYFRVRLTPNGPRFDLKETIRRPSVDIVEISPEEPGEKVS